MEVITNMDAVSKMTNPSHPEQEPNPQQQALFRACTLYSLNEMLYHNGKISLEKKQQMEHQIWKKYHV